jgi:hypothetical protein
MAKISPSWWTANPMTNTRCSASANSSRSTTPVSRVVPAMSGPLVASS